MEKKILCTLPKMIGETDKTKLEAEGYIVIEVADLDKIKLMTETGFLTGNEIFVSALKVISNYSAAQGDFGRLLLQTYIKQNEKPQGK